MLTTFALFPTAACAESSLEKLKAKGIADGDITTMFEGNVASNVLERYRFTGERAAGVIAGGDRVAAALAKLGISESLALRYAQRIEKCDFILVGVHFPDTKHADDGRQILMAEGGVGTVTVGGSLPRDAEPGDLRSEFELDSKLTGKLGRK